MTFYSQDRQDKFLESIVFKGHKSGVFVDVGAHDGRTYNNTLFFEETHGWTGINVEPIKEVYDKLVAARPTSININCAVSDTNGTAEFICNSGYTEMISGLKAHYDPRHAARLNRELAAHNGSSHVIVVPTRTLASIFDEHAISRVNYLSIDVEGAEFSVIRSINFDKVFIDVIGFENNYRDTSIPIITYLQTKGYAMLNHRSQDIFMIHRDSQFFNSAIVL
jgi:FkbM family methyltransferase